MPCWCDSMFDEQIFAGRFTSDFGLITYATKNKTKKQPSIEYLYLKSSSSTVLSLKYKSVLECADLKFLNATSYKSHKGASLSFRLRPGAQPKFLTQGRGEEMCCGATKPGMSQLDFL